MKLPKDLEKKRDELEAIFVQLNHSLVQDDDFALNLGFNAGFLCGVQAAFESDAVRGLVEALETISKETVIEDVLGTDRQVVCRTRASHIAGKILAKFKVLTGTVVENE